MNSQTVRRPENQRSARSTKSNKAKRYTKQTAHVEARRDGKPLIFGWGGHLSHTEKVRIQRRATWAVAILFGLLIIGVIVGFWINANIIVPGLPLESVNGHQIPQSQYRKLVALKTQFELNKIYGPGGLFDQRTNLEKQVASQQTLVNNGVKQVDDLNKQISKLPAGQSAQRTSLNQQLTAAKKQLTAAQTQHDKLNAQLTDLTQNLIPLEQQNFTQSQVGNDSANWLRDDELIREWLSTQSATVQAKITPTASQLSRALSDFKAGLPRSGPHASNYSQFLSRDGVTDDDIHVMMTVKLRRDNMQNYLASRIVSPAYQVLARTMTLSTMADAQKMLQQLKKGGDFGKLAKAKSVDNSTNSKGGSLDWMARGQYAYQESAATVENWLFDPARTINEISPILNENGAYHIVQIMGIDPSRAIDKATLKTLQDNALSNWELMQQALPTVNITPVDQNKLTDPANMPSDLPAGAPGQAPGAPSGLPSGAPTGP